MYHTRCNTYVAHLVVYKMYIWHTLNCSSCTTIDQTLCPSPTVPNLFPNEDESTIRVCSGVILVHSGNDNDNRFEQCSSRACSLAGRYESFEHVQKFCLPSTNNFHSCLCALRTCSYRLCRTAYMLYSSHSHCILCHSCM